MLMELAFAIEVLIAGLLSGVMYSLVALGFVLIFKASGVFNFAQGAMVLFAALTLVGLIEHGVPVIIAIFLTAAAMVALAALIERLMLRHLVNQEGIILFMATIGLNFILEQYNLHVDAEQPVIFAQYVTLWGKGYGLEPLVI